MLSNNLKYKILYLTRLKSESTSADFMNSHRSLVNLFWKQILVFDSRYCTIMGKNFLSGGYNSSLSEDFASSP